MPTITDLGFTLNRTDVSLSYNTASTIEEDTTTVEAVNVDEEDVDAQSSIATESISGDKISELSVEKLETGTISSKQITLDITTDGEGDVYYGFGTFDADAWTATGGMIMGMDDSDSNKVKFFLGDATTSMDWNVTTADTLTVAGAITATSGTIGGWVIDADSLKDAAGIVGMSSAVTGADDVRFWAGHATPLSAPFYVTEAGVLTATSGTFGGSLIAGNIHIPDQDSTANSFHVDSTGDLWMGATETNKATAPVQISPAGVFKLGDLGSTYIELNGPNGTVGSSNFATGNTGWQISNDGSAEFQNVEVRGTLHSSVFEYDVVSAIGGQIIVTNADKVGTTMTALDAANLITEGNATFVNDDILYIRADSGSGIEEEYMRVTDASGAPTYVVTRDLAAAYGADSNPTWPAGTAVVKTKNSDLSATHSGGYLQLFGEGTNSPYYSVFVSSGVAYDAFDEVARMGNLNGIAGFSSDTYGIFLGDYDARQYLTYDSVSGELLVNEASLELRAFYGDGSDGTVTISGNTTLTQDMFYLDLTINDGVTLTTGGYRVFVRRTLDLSTSGVIDYSGNDGGDAGNGGNGSASSGSASGGTAGTAGTAAAALGSGSLPGSQAGIIGLAGRAGAAQVGPGQTAGSNGYAATAGASVAKCLVSPAIAGAAGGAAGTNPSGLGGTGAAGGAAGSATGTVQNIPRALIPGYCFYDFIDSATLNSSPQNGGVGGAGSGAASCAVSALSAAAAGGSGGSGGTGGQGGIVQVFARRIVGSGTISADGGDGGDAGNAGTSAAFAGAGSAIAGGSGGGAGGAGGCGGFILCVYNFIEATVTFSSVAGTGGSAGTGAEGTPGTPTYKGADGGAGTNGTAGTTIQLRN